jgi:hypothetical protein
MWVVPAGLFLILVAVFSIGLFSGPRNNKPQMDHDRTYIKRKTDTNASQGNNVDQREAVETAPSSFPGEANRISQRNNLD